MAFGCREASDCRADARAWCQCDVGGTGTRGERQPDICVASCLSELFGTKYLVKITGSDPSAKFVLIEPPSGERCPEVLVRATLRNGN